LARPRRQDVADQHDRGFAEARSRTTQRRRDLDDTAARSRPAAPPPLGYVFQDARLFRISTCAESSTTTRMNRLPDDPPAPALTDLLDIGVSRIGPRKTSGGERQRVALAARCCRSGLLLLDDRWLARRGTRRSRILPYLIRLRDDRNSMVYVSHDARNASVATHIDICGRAR